MGAEPVALRHVSPFRRPLRALAGALALAIGLAALPVQAAGPSGAPDPREIQRLYVEGQERNESEDFKGASESWTRLLNLLPESGSNKTTRENLIINILEAHINAYKRIPDQGGKKEISHLEHGKTTLDKYYEDFKTVHGDRVAINAQVQEKADELERLLDDARKVAAEPVPEPKDEPDVKTDPTTPPADDTAMQQPRRDDAGNGLIIGGGVTLGVGVVVGVSMIAAGSVLGNKFEQDYKDAEDDIIAAQQQNDADAEETARDNLDNADDNGKRANAILISGAVVGGVLIAAGAVLLGFGIKQRRASGKMARIESFSPYANRYGAGFGLTGRF